MIDRKRDLLIVTPEHVEIRLTPAGLGSRFLAATADFLLVISVAALISRLAEPIFPPGVAFAVVITVDFFLTFAYHVYFETKRSGRTPGKKLAGLRVVDRRGLPLTVEQSMVRNILRAVDKLPLFYGVGAIVTLIDKHGRRFGDLVADTVVISETTPPERTAAIGVTRSFNSLRTPKVLAAIRNRVSLEEREFLLALCIRAESLEPIARYDLMQEVAAYYAAKLSVDDPFLSGENLVRDLTSLLFSDQMRLRKAERAA